MPSVSWLLLLLLLLLLLELLLEPLLASCWFTLLSSWFHSCSYTTAPLLPYHHIDYMIKSKLWRKFKSNQCCSAESEGQLLMRTQGLFAFKGAKVGDIR